MSLPFTPEDARGLISDPTSSLCGNLVKTLLRLPVLFYQLINFLFDDSGNPKAMFSAGDIKYSFSTVGEDAHWKLCNGQTLDKDDHAVLFAAIGATYDTMDGQSAPGGNLFRVPKCSAKFPLTTGSLPSTTSVSVGDTGGEEDHVLTEIELAKHTHNCWPQDDGDGNAGKLWRHRDPGSGSDTVDLTTGIEPNNSGSATTLLVAEEQATGDGGHNTMPPYFGVYTLICTGI